MYSVFVRGPIEAAHALHPHDARLAKGDGNDGRIGRNVARLVAVRADVIVLTDTVCRNHVVDADWATVNDSRSISLTKCWIRGTDWNSL